MKKTGEIAFFTAALTMFSLLGGKAESAVTAVVKIISPTELEIMLSGSLSSPAASNFPNEIAIDLGDSTSKYTDTISPASIIGEYDPLGAMPSGTLFNNPASAGDTMQVAVVRTSFRLGDSLSGAVTFSYNVPHQINPSDAYRVYWGSTIPNGGGSLQSSGTVVPEPSAIALIGLALYGVAGTRRARR